MATTEKRMGGSFAPPIDDAKIKRYEDLAEGADRRIKDYMLELIDMLVLFRQTPESKNEAKPHPTGVGTVRKLEDSEIERIWDLVPYPEECDTIGKAFDVLPNGELRNAAYHLLWFARELAADREPLTNDKL